MRALREYSLPDLLEFIVDNRGRTCPTADTGLPLIATNCIKDDHLYPVYDNVRHVNEDTYENWFRAHPLPGDIIFVCKGSPGRIAMVPDPVPFCIAQDMVALRANPSIVDNRYLYYMLKWQDTRNKIANMHVGTMIPHFKKGDFGKLKLNIHAEMSDQHAIAEVLGALDEKIAANAKIIATAELLSRTLFNSLLDENARSTPLSETAQFINGKAFTKNATGTGRVVIRIAELNSGLGGSTVCNDIDVAPQHLALPGTILFAWSGSLTLHRWFRREGIVNQHIFKVIPASGHPDWLIFELLRKKLDDFKSIAADKATTMGHIQRKHLDEPVQVPSDSMVRRHNLLMQSLWDQSLNAELENESLAATRDTLLPQLMSGKLHVKDAERYIAAAV